MDRDKIGLKTELSKRGLSCYYHMLLALGVALSAEIYTLTFVVDPS